MAFTETKNIRRASLMGTDLESEIPNIPQEVTEKFPELNEFNRQLNDFWSSVKTSLIRYEERINELENP